MLKKYVPPWTRGKIRKYLRNLVEFLNLKFRFWLGDPPYYCFLIWGELRCFFDHKRWIRCSLTPMAPTNSGHTLWRGHGGGALFDFPCHLFQWNNIFHQPEALTFVTSPGDFSCFQASASLKQKLEAQKTNFHIINPNSTEVSGKMIKFPFSKRSRLWLLSAS